MNRIITSAFAAALTVTPALADGDFTGGDLYEYCTSKYEMHLTACRFFVLGVVQGFATGESTYMDSVTQKPAFRPKTMMCVPDNMGQEQMVAVVRDMMAQEFRAFPADREMPAVSLTAAIMGRRFPCRAGR